VVEKGYCRQGEIVGIVEGGDRLLGNNVLRLYNALYQMYRVGAVYSSYLVHEAPR